MAHVGLSYIAGTDNVCSVRLKIIELSETLRRNRDDDISMDSERNSDGVVCVRSRVLCAE